MEKIIKKLILLEIALIIATIISTFVFESTLDPVLQEYLNVTMWEDVSVSVGIAYVAALIFLLFHLVAMAGLLLTKLWAKNLYIWSMIGVLVACFFLGAYVDSAVSYAFDQITTLVNGMVIALLIYNSDYSEAALNKSSKRDASTGAPS